MKTNRQPASGTRERRATRDTYDEADWVDWDHWRTVEEIQDFRNGLGDGHGDEGQTDLADSSEQIARQIRRYGLEVEG